MTAEIIFVATLTTAASPIFPIFTMALLLALSTGSTACEGFVLAPDVINQFPLFSRRLAPGERRVEELRAALLHEPRGVDGGFRPDRGIADDDVAGGERLAHRIEHIEERLRVRDEDLDDVAQLRHLAGRREEIRGGARSPIPDVNVEAAEAQGIRDPGTDDAEADQANILARFFGHLQGS